MSRDEEKFIGACPRNTLRNRCSPLLALNWARGQFSHTDQRRKPVLLQCFSLSVLSKALMHLRSQTQVSIFAIVFPLTHGVCFLYLPPTSHTALLLLFFLFFNSVPSVLSSALFLSSPTFSIISHSALLLHPSGVL